MLLLLAVLPGVILFAAARRQDKIEKEPADLLWKLFLGGALTTVSAMLLGWLGGEVVTELVDTGNIAFLIIDNFLLTALVVPVLLHGFYDFCLETESGLFTILFIVFDVALTILAIRRIKAPSRADAPV